MNVWKISNHLYKAIVIELTPAKARELVISKNPQIKDYLYCTQIGSAASHLRTPEIVIETYAS